MPSHWGTLSDSNDGVSVPDLVKKLYSDSTSKKNSGCPFDAAESEHMNGNDENQAVAHSENPPQKSLVFTLQFDPLTMHTVQLLQSCRKIRNQILKIQLTPNQSCRSAPGFSVSLPRYSGKPIKQYRRKPFQLDVTLGERDFVRGIGKPVTVFGSSCTKRVLKKSVAALTAHAGFDDAMDSALDALTDATSHFLETLCTRLRHSTDGALFNNSHPFPDVVQHALTEVGIGHYEELLHFYENRVIRYHEFVLKQTFSLIKELESLQQSVSVVGADEKLNIISIKEEALESATQGTNWNQSSLDEFERIVQMAAGDADVAARLDEEVVMDADFGPSSNHEAFTPQNRMRNSVDNSFGSSLLID